MKNNNPKPKFKVGEKIKLPNDFVEYIILNSKSTHRGFVYELIPFTFLKKVDIKEQFMDSIDTANTYTLIIDDILEITIKNHDKNRY